jgi:hypothetical protein
MFCNTPIDSIFIWIDGFWHVTDLLAVVHLSVDCAGDVLIILVGYSSHIRDFVLCVF